MPISGYTSLLRDPLEEQCCTTTTHIRDPRNHTSPSGLPGPHHHPPGFQLNHLDVATFSNSSKPFSPKVAFSITWWQSSVSTPPPPQSSEARSRHMVIAMQRSMIISASRVTHYPPPIMGRQQLTVPQSNGLFAAEPPLSLLSTYNRHPPCLYSCSSPPYTNCIYLSIQRWNDRIRANSITAI